MTINARSGCGLVAIFGIIVWRAHVFLLIAGLADILSRSHPIDMLDVSLYRNEYTPGNVMAEL